MSFVPRSPAEMALEAERLQIAWPEILPERFSATQATMFKRCPEQYRQRYVLGLKSPPGGALIIGRADSKTIGTHFQTVMQLGQEKALSVDGVGELYAENFEKEIEEVGGVREVKWIKEQSPLLGQEGARKMADREKDTGIKTAQAYRRTVADLVHPIAVEREFEMVDPLWPVPVLGYLDIEEETKIIERKTAARKKSKLRPDWTLQGRVYQLAVPKDMFWHQSVKTKEPYAIGDDATMMVPLDETARFRTKILLAQTMRSITQNLHTYGPDSPWPDALIHDWACGFCGYRDRCSWWGN